MSRICSWLRIVAAFKMFSKTRDPSRLPILLCRCNGELYILPGCLLSYSLLSMTFRLASLEQKWKHVVPRYRPQCKNIN